MSICWDVRVGFVLPGAPPSLQDIYAVALVTRYLARLAQIVSDARKTFL
jgi:hypothetical protein